MVSPFQGRPPTQQPFPPASRQPFNWVGPNPPGGFTEAPVEKTGIQGLLQKFLPAAKAGGASSGGGISGTLNNIQQILKMSQSVTPLIQQYGPMVKNLPTMLTLLKAFQESDEIDEEAEESDSEIESEEIATDDLAGEVEKNKVDVTNSTDDLYHIETEGRKPSSKKTNKYQTSKPKLYI